MKKDDVRGKTVPALPAMTALADTADLVALTDAEGRLLYCNRPFRAGDDIAALFPADAHAALTAAWQKALSGMPARVDIPDAVGDGGRRWLTLGVSAVVGGDGGRHVLCVGLDISGRVQEEVRLRRFEELMTDTEDIAHYGIWEWDITQPHAVWSRGLYIIYGETPTSYTPSYEGYLAKVHPDDRQRVIDATNGAFHEHRPYSHDERVFHTDGSIRYLHTWAVPILDGEGKLVRLMGVCLDITDRKLAELGLAEHAEELHRLNAELERRVAERTRELSEAKNLAVAANESKSRFLAAMSHEVRTPMNGVLGMLELLLENGFTAEQRRMLLTVRESAQSLLGILDDILDFSKIEAGKMDLEALPVNLQQLVESVSDTQVAAAQGKQLRLHCLVDPALPEWVSGDPVRLRQILLNLASNAVKFTGTTAERRGEVCIAAEVVAERDGRVELQFVVSDNGIGMSAETRALLFRPFSQADLSTTRRYGGTGLGLSICRHLVDLMGGTIDVDSAPGTGSVFRVRLSLPVAEGTHAFDASALAGVHVVALVHPGQTQRVLQAYLRAAGATLDAYGDAYAFRSALQASAGNSPVALVGPEYPEPEVAGWLPSLRAAVGNPALPVVVLAPRQDGNPPLLPAGLVRVWAWPLRRQELLDGIAQGAGHVSVVVPPPATRAARAPAPDSPLILVAEDNVVNQEILRRQVEHLGYRSVIAENGRVALALLREQRFELLLTDCYMPEMDGFELARNWRQLESEAPIDAAGNRRRLPIVAITANAMRGEAERCLQAGMDDYLSKPVQLASLRQTLERWLGASARTGA